MIVRASEAQPRLCWASVPFPDVAPTVASLNVRLDVMAAARERNDMVKVKILPCDGPAADAALSGVSLVDPSVVDLLDGCRLLGRAASRRAVAAALAHLVGVFARPLATALGVSLWIASLRFSAPSVDRVFVSGVVSFRFALKFFGVASRPLSLPSGVTLWAATSIGRLVAAHLVFVGVAPLSLSREIVGRFSTFSTLCVDSFPVGGRVRTHVFGLASLFFFSTHRSILPEGTA